MNGGVRLASVAVCRDALLFGTLASGSFLCYPLVHGDDCELMDGFDSILVMMVDDEVLLF